jgi:type IV pilus biogenesis protein CpaD/CtpE
MLSAPSVQSYRIRNVLRVPLAVLVVAAAVTAAGCGGGDSSASGTAPDDYAASVCGAVQDWQNDLQASISSMGSDLSTSSSAADVKTKLVEFMDSATTATHKMLTKVKAAGPPAIDNGEELQSDLESGLAKAEKAFAQARDKAKSLPANDRAAFQRQAAALATTLNQQGTAIGTTFKGLEGKYNSKELNEAFDKQPACKNV